MQNHFYPRTPMQMVFCIVAYLGGLAGPSLAGWPGDNSKKVINQFLEKTNVPFSFTYDGRTSRQFLDQWQISHTCQEETDRTLHTITYADPATKLEIVSEVIEYRDYPAVEWIHYFTNKGDQDTPILTKVNALDTNFTVDPVQGEVVLHRVLGCTSTVSDFAPVDEVLFPGYSTRIASIRGRSSNGNMPFFNLEITGNHGAILAIGWTGQWEATFHRDYAQNGIVNTRAGMERTNLKLHPGEQIRTPSVLLFFWRGDQPIYGHNQYRRFIVKHHTPHLDGQPVDLILAASTWWTLQLGNGYSEQNQQEYLDRYKKNGLAVNCWWMDAGWFEGGWPSGVGNWFPRTDGFPNGLKALSQKVHEEGLKFLLWFEPERVAETSQIYREHPEWTLAAPEGAQNRGEVYCPDIHGPTNYLFDMGNSEARKWLTDHIAALIEENGIDIYRHDANIDPMNFWPTNEDPQRVGIREIRYIEGLYDFWEELKRRKPGLIVECCCSGNRRFDLETITRTVNLWRSDYFRESNCNQAQMYGLSQYVVLHGLGTLSVDKYAYRSVLGPSIVVEWPVNNPDFDFDLGRHNIELFYKTRELFYGDYYPLTPYSVKQSVWLAYQFHREDLTRGVVFAFRRPVCEDSELMVRLGGLLPDKRYEVENVDTHQKAISIGSDLAAGLNLQATEKPQAIVLLYQQID